MILLLLSDTAKFRSEKPAHRFAVVLDYVESAAADRTSHSKRGDHRMTSRYKAAAQNLGVPKLLFRLAQEVEHGPVVPDIERMWRIKVQQILREPLDFRCTFPQALPHFCERSMSDVEQCDVAVTKRQKPVHEQGGASADVQKCGSSYRWPPGESRPERSTAPPGTSSLRCSPFSCRHPASENACSSFVILPGEKPALHDAAADQNQVPLWVTADFEYMVARF